jgi:hypothetical protein
MERKPIFWEMLWLHGRKPKDVVALIFIISTRKIWNVKQVLHNDRWISKINMIASVLMDHICQYLVHWALIWQVNLQDGVGDDISWSPLCKLCPESVDHLFLHCRFTIRLWGLIEDWLGLHFIDHQTWTMHTIFSWWSTMTKHKDLASITLLASCEIWNERNARVFKNKHAPSSVIIGKIKFESNLWIWPVRNS